MPYIKNDKVNILFIHIPKACGTSISNYLLEKHGVIRNVHKHPYSMISGRNKFRDVSFQHQTYLTIKANTDYFDIDFENITLLTYVRNPYTRILSDLFFWKLITPDTTPDAVYNRIKEFIASQNVIKFDNHPLPQYQFILDEDGSVLKNITILRTETITEDMKSLGYDDFQKRDNKSPIDTSDYQKYFNEESIKLIRDHYAKDFEIFGYED